MPTICLNMIVKNEAHVIERCLSSVKPYIDNWVVVDTGSTDGTQERIKALLAEFPGQLYERPWRDFGSNRDEALQLARGRSELVLFVDADEELIGPPRRDLRFPMADASRIRQESMSTAVSFLSTKLIRSDKPWRWVGVIHEYLTCDAPHAVARLDGLLVRGHFDSARNRDHQKKHLNDALALEEALETEPNNARYMFYLGQEYRFSEQFEKAEAAYQRRISMGGWEEEVWYSMYQLGCVRAALQRPWEEVEKTLLDAFWFRPRRAEPLWFLATCCRDAERHAAALRYADAAMRLPIPDDALFLRRDVYRWRALDEYATAAVHVGRIDEALWANRRLAADKAVPESERARLLRNIDRCLASQRGASEDPPE